MKVLTSPSSAWAPPPHAEKMLVNILKLSKKLIIQSGIEYATYFLNELKLPPARRLELSRIFSIHEWVHSAIEGLVAMELTDLLAAEEQQIGFETYTILSRTKAHIDRERKLIAQVPPPMKFLESFDCTDHQMCKAVWKDVWWKKVGKQIVHPMNPLALHQVPAFVAKTDFPGMYEGCKEEMEIIVRQHHGFQIEAEIIQGAVDAVVAFHRNLEY